MIIDHTHEVYKSRWYRSEENRFNGAYYYSREIVDNIIPHVNTDRHWVTVNAGIALDHSIVFIHNNLMPELYDWLKSYEDLVLVCGIPETCDKVKRLGNAIYLPLSVDVEEVKSYKQKKTEEVCYAGRKQKLPYNFPDNVEIISNLPRPLFLKRLAAHKKAYAVGRAAIEAKILGCEILPYDPRFPDPERWQVLDNKEAAKILQEKLDKIDGKRGS